MSLDNKGFFDYHIESIRNSDATLGCPVRMGSLVLEKIGVTLPTSEFHAFIEDLKANNIRSKEEKEEV